MEIFQILEGCYDCAETGEGSPGNLRKKENPKGRKNFLKGRGTRLCRALGGIEPIKGKGARRKRKIVEMGPIQLNTRLRGVPFRKEESGS